MAKRVYWVCTGLLCLMMTGSAGAYLVTTFLGDGQVAAVFAKLGYPTYLVVPLAIAKLAGVTAIITRRFPLVAEWAYAGFCFDLILAVGAHLSVRDGEFGPALVGLILLTVSRYLQDSARMPFGTKDPL